MSEYDKNRGKKKFFSSQKEKESFLRRPVILVKSDREGRDLDREKQPRERVVLAEKEKQPVILIKAREREPSTTKEPEVRPHSPKKSVEAEVEIESQIIQPTKIAQNENKDKKKPQVSEVNNLIPPIPMPHPLKLIDESHDFSSSVADYLQDTNSGFLVVGVIGSQGVGKSTILNILANSHDVSDIGEKILRSQDEDFHNSNLVDSDTSQYSQGDAAGYKSLEDDFKSFTVESSNKKEDLSSKESFVFKCQNMEQIERGEACTSGIDIYITDSRVILLDAAASGGCGLSRPGPGSGVSPGGGGRAAGGGSGLESAALLLAVCHVVILVQDWFTDVNMLRFVQSAEMVKPAIPTASNSNQPSSHQSSAASSNSISESGDSPLHREYYPHLLFLQNKCSAEDFKPASVKMMQDLYRKAFHKSKMHIESGMHLYDNDSNDNSCSIDGLFHNLNTDRCGKPVNLFLLPSVEENQESTSAYRGHPTIEELANRLRWQVFGVTRNQLTSVQLTERSWLQYCSKAWDNIRKSTFFIEYGRLLP